MNWLSITFVVVATVMIVYCMRELQRRPERRLRTVSMILMMLCIIYQNGMPLIGVPVTVLLSVPAWVLILSAAGLFLLDLRQHGTG